MNMSGWVYVPLSLIALSILFFVGKKLIKAGMDEGLNILFVYLIVGGSLFSAFMHFAEYDKFFSVHLVVGYNLFGIFVLTYSFFLPFVTLGLILFQTYKARKKE